MTALSASRLAALGLLFLTPLPAAADGTQRIAHDLQAGDLTLRFLEDPDTAFVDTLRILRDRKVLYEGVFETRAAALTLPPGDPQGVLPLGLDSDVTGDGQPDLVLQSFSGGDTCCYYTLIFERSPELQLLAELAGEESPVVWRDLNGQPGLEPVLRDWTFAAWKAGPGEAPAPEVVLDLQDGGYVGAMDLMRRPPPDAAALSALAAEIGPKLAAAGKATPALWGPMLDLIYSGNGEAAFALAEQAWPAGLAGKDAFLLQFGAQLSFSPFWDTVSALNGWTTEP